MKKVRGVYWLGKKRSEETKRKIGAASKGRKMSLSSRQKLSISHRGEKCHWWKGGITPKNRLVRESWRFRRWRKSVFERDNYTCQECGIRSKENQRVYLHAHHIKPFALFVKERFILSNGVTLCRECHRKTDTFAGKIQNYPHPIACDIM